MSVSLDITQILISSYCKKIGVDLPCGSWTVYSSNAL